MENNPIYIHSVERNVNKVVLKQYSSV